MHTQFVISLLQRLKLLLGRDKLCIEEVHLLCGNNVFGHDIGLPGSWRLSSDVVESILVVHFEVRVFELPRLSWSAMHFARTVLYQSYSDAVRRGAALLIVVSHFVEVVLVKLAHETREVAVLEVFR